MLPSTIISPQVYSRFWPEYWIYYMNAQLGVLIGVREKCYIELFILLWYGTGNTFPWVRCKRTSTITKVCALEHMKTFSREWIRVSSRHRAKEEPCGLFHTYVYNSKTLAFKTVPCLSMNKHPEWPYLRFSVQLCNIRNQGFLNKWLILGLGG